jgi:hypothetical protein
MSVLANPGNWSIGLLCGLDVLCDLCENQHLPTVSLAEREISHKEHQVHLARWRAHTTEPIQSIENRSRHLKAVVQALKSSVHE